MGTAADAGDAAARLKLDAGCRAREQRKCRAQPLPP